MKPDIQSKGYAGMGQPANQLDCALECVHRGWSVFPVYEMKSDGTCSCGGRSNCSPGKHPRTPNGFVDATTDEEQITAWWTKWPNANVGIRTGSESGIIVLDEDPRNGGDHTRAEWEREHGELPETVRVKTGGGGAHYYFRYSNGLEVRGKTIGEGLEIKGDGGYIVAPPSNHASGGVYEFDPGAHPDDTTLAPMPDWLLALATARRGEGRRQGKRANDVDFSPADLLPIEGECRWLRHCRDYGANLSEPEWYASLSIYARCKDGEVLAQERSKSYPSYSPEETAEKLQHALKDAGPRTCETISGENWGKPHCTTCQNVGKISTPLDLGRVNRLAEARTRVADLASRTKDDAGAPFEPETLGALALLRAKDPSEWARQRKILKELGVSMSDLNARLKAHRRRDGSHLRIVSPGEAAPTRTAGSMLTDAPSPEIAIPDPYVLRNNSTGNRVHTDAGWQEISIAYAPVLITGRLYDAEEDSQALEVAWRRPQGWCRKVIDRAEALDAKRLVILASAGFPVASDNARELAHYLHRLEAENYQRLPSTRVSSHLGWQGSKGEAGFLHGRTFLPPSVTANANAASTNAPVDEEAPTVTPIMFRGQASGDEQIADGYHAEGTLEEWFAAVSPLQKYPRAMFVLYTSFVPPLLMILDAPNFILDIAFRTTTGKTSLARVAASVWGKPDERSSDTVVGSWDSTRVWTERASAVLSGLPLIMDDTKRARYPKLIAEMLYAVANGRGRGRGNTTSLARTRTWRTVLISTGEARATSFTEDGGTRTRVIELYGNPFVGEDPQTRRLVDQVNSGIRRAYGHAGPMFVKGLIERRGVWEALKAKYRKAADRYADTAPSSEAGRLAQYVAAIKVAAELAHEELELPWAFDFSQFDEVFQQVAGEASDAAGELRALRDVISWAQSNEASFVGRHETIHDNTARVPNAGWSGRWDKDPAHDRSSGEPPVERSFVAFYPHVIKRILEQFGYHPDAILSAWRDRGWLDVTADDRKRFTKRVRIDVSADDLKLSNKMAHLIVIRREAIEEADA